MLGPVLVALIPSLWCLLCIRVPEVFSFFLCRSRASWWQHFQHYWRFWATLGWLLHNFLSLLVALCRLAFASLVLFGVRLLCLAFVGVRRLPRLPLSCLRFAMLSHSVAELLARARGKLLQLSSKILFTLLMGL